MNNLGSSWNRNINSRSTSNAKNVAWPNGWNRYDQWWVQNLFILIVMQFWDKLMSNIQQQKALSNWLESKIKKSVTEQPALSSQQVNLWSLPSLSWKWTFIQLLSFPLIIKLSNSPKKSLKIVQNQSIQATMKKFFLPYKIVLVPSSPADGENLFQTSPSKPLKSLWEKEPKRNLISKSKDTLKLKKFPVELFNNLKFLKVSWSTRTSLIQRWEEQLKTQESFYLTVH